MYALMLLPRADLIAEFQTLEDAERALDRLTETGAGEYAGIVELDEKGRPVGDPISRRDPAVA
jgi:hypothetical protein